MKLLAGSVVDRVFDEVAAVAEHEEHVEAPVLHQRRGVAEHELVEVRRLDVRVDHLVGGVAQHRVGDQAAGRGVEQRFVQEQVLRRERTRAALLLQVDVVAEAAVDLVARALAQVVVDADARLDFVAEAELQEGVLRVELLRELVTGQQQAGVDHQALRDRDVVLHEHGVGPRLRQLRRLHRIVARLDLRVVLHERERAPPVRQTRQVLGRVFPAEARFDLMLRLREVEEAADRSLHLGAIVALAAPALAGAADARVQLRVEEVAHRRQVVDIERRQEPEVGDRDGLVGLIEAEIFHLDRRARIGEPVPAAVGDAVRALRVRAERRRIVDADVAVARLAGTVTIGAIEEVRVRRRRGDLAEQLVRAHLAVGQLAEVVAAIAGGFAAHLSRGVEEDAVHAGSARRRRPT